MPSQSIVLAGAGPALINNLAKVAPSLLQNLPPLLKPDRESATVPDPMVAAYQAVLQIERRYKGKIDGRPGRKTAGAFNVYQTERHLSLTGRADSQTRAEMKL